MPYFRDSHNHSKTSRELENFSDDTDIRCHGCNSWMDTSLSECYFCGTKLRHKKKYKMVEKQIGNSSYKVYEQIDPLEAEIIFQETEEERFVEMLLRD